MSNTPLGFSAEVMISGREYKLDPLHVIMRQVVISSAARYGTSTTLPKGMVLGLQTSTGKFVEYDDDGTDDGRRVARGILDVDIDLLNDAGVAADTYAPMLIHGFVDESSLFGIDANGKTDLIDGKNGCSLIFG